MVRASRICMLIVSFIAASMTVGCQSYRAPGSSADMSMFSAAHGMSEEEIDEATDYRIRRMLDRKPLASFPVNLAVARVQAPGYRSETVTSHGSGRYSVVTTRDVETDEAYEKVGSLPMIEGVASLNRLVLPDRLNSDEELRAAAAGVRANMLLVYTFDTNIYVGDTNSPVDVITLGFLPNKQAQVVTTASAVLMDTRNGYVYGTAEGTGRTTQRANAWTRREAVDQSRRRTEAEAFEKLVDSFAETWGGVVEQYQPASAEAE